MKTERRTSWMKAAANSRACSATFREMIDNKNRKFTDEA